MEEIFHVEYQQRKPMDYLVNFLVWILGVYGMSTIIVHSNIMRPVRDFLNYKDREYDEYGNLVKATIRKFDFFGKLVNCILCMGFWVGVFWDTFYWSPLVFSYANWFISALFAGCLGSGTTWLIYLKVYPLMSNK